MKHTSNNIRIWKGGEMMKLVCLTILACLVLATAACATTTYTQILYPAPGYPDVQDTGLNYFAMKGVPLNPDPAVILGNVPIDGVLGRWDAVTASPISYDQFGPEGFGGMLLGEGYQIAINPNPDNTVDGTWTISYDGIDDGIPDGVNEMTDIWISLPGVTAEGGLQWVGHPFNHDVLWEDVQVTDGTQTISVTDACNNGWLESAWQYWDPVSQSPMSIDIFDDYGMYMHPGISYVVPTLRSNLALIIPAD